MKQNQLLLIILLTLLAVPLSAQKRAKEKPLLIPYRKGNLWGFANERKKVVIPPQFEKAGFFKHENNLYYAEGILHGKPVIITEDGQYMADEFSSGQGGWIDLGMSIEWYQEAEEDATLSANGKHGFRLKEGKFTHAPVYEFATSFFHEESLAILKLKDTRKFGVADTAGNILIPFEYDRLFPIDSKALIFAGQTGQKWRIIDGTNKRVNPSDFDEVYEAANDRVRARKDGKYGYLDRKGGEVIPFKYDVAHNFSEDPAINNFALVGYKDFEFFIDVKGREFAEK
jgi:hypothetical protein